MPAESSARSRGGPGRLHAQGVSFSYGPHPVLAGVDICLDHGRWVAVLGPNGCGKSTLLRLMVGLARPEAGQITVDGVAIDVMSARERGRRVGFLPQIGVRPEGLNVEEVVGLGRLPQLGLLGRPGAADADAIESAMRVTEIQTLRHRALKTLSGGEVQRVLLARALAAEPRYLLLDEPTNHLDLHHQAAFLGLISRLRSEGVGVLTVLHDPNQAWGADHVVMLQDGAVVMSGSPREVISERILKSVYGPEVVVEVTPSGRSVVLPGQGTA